MKYILLILSFVISTSAYSADFLNILSDATEASENVSAQHCKVFFNTVLDTIKEEALQNSDSNPQTVLVASWRLRKTIHGKLDVIPNCRAEVRKAFYQLRAIEDLAGVKAYKTASLTGLDIDFQNQPIPMRENKEYNGYLGASGNVEQSPLNIESGDILVTRGTSFFSAMLSNISENKGQFSHFVLLHKAQDGAEHSIESYAQTGGVSRFDMTYALKNENARILHLRAKNKDIAHNAAEIMMNRVLEGEKDPSKQITYDFYINLEDKSKMTCSEIAYWGFADASSGTFMLPEQKSSLHPGLKQIFEQTGIKPDPMMTPQDIEVDSRFEMLAEFRDYRLVRDTRYRDAVLISIFDWMKNYGYELKSTANSVAIDYIVYPLRRTPLWPLVKAVTGSPDFPIESPKGFVKTLKQLNDVSDVLYKKLKDHDDEFYSKTGWSMSNAQLLDVLTKYRTDDAERFKNRQSNDFHYFFRPEGLRNKTKE